MPRVKRGKFARARKKRVLKKTKGYTLGRKSLIKRATEARMKAGMYAFRDRRAKKRDFRELWNIRINAAARENGMTYSQLISGLKKANIDLDRKVLADLAVHQPKIFAQIVEAIKK